MPTAVSMKDDFPKTLRNIPNVLENFADQSLDYIIFTYAWFLASNVSWVNLVHKMSFLGGDHLLIQSNECSAERSETLRMLWKISEIIQVSS